MLRSHTPQGQSHARATHRMSTSVTHTRVVMGTHFVFYVVLLRLVQMHLDQPTAVQLHADPLAHNLAGEHQVFQDGIMHGGQGTAVGAQSTLTTDQRCSG